MLSEPAPLNSFEGGNSVNHWEFQVEYLPLSHEDGYAEFKQQVDNA